MNETRIAAFAPDAPGYEEIARREAQLMEIDGKIARESRELCEEINRGEPLTAIDAHVTLLRGMYTSRDLILNELRRAGGYVTEAYERRRRACGLRNSAGSMV